MPRIVITVDSNEHADEILEALHQRQASIQEIAIKMDGTKLGETAKAKVKRIQECMTAVDEADEK